MKPIIFLLLLVILFTCFGCITKDLGKDDISNHSVVVVFLKCQEIDKQLPKISVFYKNPLELYKNIEKNTDQMPVDSIAKIWDGLFQTKEAEKLNNMFPGGCSFVGNKVGKYWIATTAIIKDQEIFVWVQEADFVIGSKDSVELTCGNRIKF